MYQVIQNVKDGKLSLAEVTPPSVQGNQVLIANRASLVSAGTEKMLMEFASKGLIAKAKERPDQVKRVLEKIQTDGWRETYRQIQGKLDQPIGLGYSSSGVVIGVGEKVRNYRVGDRVASNGPHATFVSVSENLVARVPDSVSFRDASFAVVGSIALQGVRLSKCTLGETVFVIGLGLVGQLTVGLLQAAGCRVVGMDPDQSKCDLALKSGATLAQPKFTGSQIEELTSGYGADAVIITASTSSNDPIDLACAAVRQKGRIVLVGVVGLELSRRPMYFKEAEFVVSCSYGPGRYDSNYEERGIDYPMAYVRWTEQRNIQAVLELIGRDKLQVGHLVSHEFEIKAAESAYSLIKNNSEPYLGIVLNYPPQMIEEPQKGRSLESVSQLDSPLRVVSLANGPTRAVAHSIDGGKPRIGVLGVGNFAKMTMLPAITKSGAFKHSVLCSASGLTATHARNAFGYQAATSSENDLFKSESLDAIFVLTRHDLHARQVIMGLDGGKHLFVEKPLAIKTIELCAIREAIDRNPSKIVMVGYNRRFSAAAAIAKQHFENVRAPLTLQYRFNAGAIPADHWVQNISEGGGRIIGEACHAIDFVTFLAGSRPVEVHAISVSGSMAPRIHDDQSFITIRHANGSISSIGYLAGGDRTLPKERIEVFGGGRACVVDDFKSVECYSGGRMKAARIRSGKGHFEEVKAFAIGIETGKWPIEWADLESTSLAAIAAVNSLQSGRPIRISDMYHSKTNAA